MNSVFVIEAYRHAGTWAFTDKAKGLVDEPFVCGIPQIIDEVLGSQEFDRAQILFSEGCFPGYAVELTAQQTEYGGRWYATPDVPGPNTYMRGWLCPATLKYFDAFPDKIFVAVSPL